MRNSSLVDGYESSLYILDLAYRSAHFTDPLLSTYKMLFKT